jgi:hypothetical protein
MRSAGLLPSDGKTLHGWAAGRERGAVDRSHTIAPLVEGDAAGSGEAA